MNPTVEQLCERMAERRLVSSADLSRLRQRWFQPGRKEVAEVEPFGQWLAVNGYLTAFTFRMLRDGKADLLRLNQYQLVDHLPSGPFAGAYLAADPVQRQVVVEVLSADRAASAEAVRAFQAAAEKALTVRHPNVNLTLDFGEAQGRHYLVREFEEGETLADILAHRGKLQPVAAARLFALALLGLQALNEKQVPAGPLDAESFLLTTAGKSAGGKARTVKILNAGVPRTLFDPAALDATIVAATPRAIPPQPADAQEDLIRLGIVFYRSLTGHPPFAADAPAGEIPRAMPIRQRTPDVPEVLAHLVESMIDPDPVQRHRGAAHAAKALRVFLASEEEIRHGQPEDHLVPHHPAPASIPAAEETAAETPPAKEPAVGEGELVHQFNALWGELRPGPRDLVFLSIGAAAVIVLVLFVSLLTGIHFVNLVCLLTGGALSFFVERLLRLREEHSD